MSVNSAIILFLNVSFNVDVTDITNDGVDLCSYTITLSKNGIALFGGEIQKFLDTIGALPSILSLSGYEYRVVPQYYEATQFCQWIYYLPKFKSSY